MLFLFLQNARIFYLSWNKIQGQVLMIKRLNK